MKASYRLNSKKRIMMMRKDDRKAEASLLLDAPGTGLAVVEMRGDEEAEQVVAQR